MRGNIQIGFLRWSVKMKEKDLVSFVSFEVQFRKVCAVYIHMWDKTILAKNYSHKNFFLKKNSSNIWFLGLNTVGLYWNLLLFDSPYSAKTSWLNFSKIDLAISEIIYNLNTHWHLFRIKTFIMVGFLEPLL